MCIYENYSDREIPDYGRQIACCNISRFWVMRSSDDQADWEKARADEPDVKVMTAR